MTTKTIKVSELGQGRTWEACRHNVPLFWVVGLICIICIVYPCHARAQHDGLFDIASIAFVVTVLKQSNRIVSVMKKRAFITIMHILPSLSPTFLVLVVQVRQRCT